MINDNGRIETDWYTKATDKHKRRSSLNKHRYLAFISCHPTGCRDGNPYAQAMQLRRICSTSAAFARRAVDLCQFLVVRAYKEQFVRQQIQKARAKTREEALTPRPSKINDGVPQMVVTYHPGLPNIRGILRDLQPILHCSDKCRVM